MVSDCHENAPEDQSSIQKSSDVFGILHLASQLLLHAKITALIFQ